MSLAFDEFGRPFIIIKVRRRPVAAHPGSARTATPRRDLASVPTASRSPASPRFRSPLRPLSSRQQEQGNKSRIRGIEAQKANIQAAKSVARTLRSSLGPKVRIEQGRPISRVATRKRAQRTPIANSQTAAEKVHRVYGVFIRERTPLDDASDDTRELTTVSLRIPSLYCLHT